jgi:DNA topoisomerase VI subunit B
MSTAITRTVFTTSRLLEFCTVAELTKLVGFAPVYWPIVVVKEGSDNALDACEEAGVAPEIEIAVSTKKGSIAIRDNGPGIISDTITHLLDYRNKTSSREAYVGPSRGAQGNALQSLLAMPFALDGTTGKSVIEAHGIAHHISFSIDPVRREPRIAHEQRPSSVHSGTCVTLFWPHSAS